MRRIEELLQAGVQVFGMEKGMRGRRIQSIHSVHFLLPLSTLSLLRGRLHTLHFRPLSKKSLASPLSLEAASSDLNNQAAPPISLFVLPTMHVMNQSSPFRLPCLCLINHGPTIEAEAKCYTLRGFEIIWRQRCGVQLGGKLASKHCGCPQSSYVETVRKYISEIQEVRVDRVTF